MIYGSLPLIYWHIYTDKWFCLLKFCFMLYISTELQQQQQQNEERSECIEINNKKLHLIKFRLFSTSGFRFFFLYQSSLIPSLSLSCSLLPIFQIINQIKDMYEHVCFKNYRFFGYVPHSLSLYLFHIIIIIIMIFPIPERHLNNWLF